MRIASLVAVCVVGLALRASETFAQDEVAFRFGAAVSYAYDFAEPENPTNNSTHYASFERNDAFSVDIVQLHLEGRRGAAGYGAKIDLGDLARLVRDSVDGDVALQEAYLEYDFGPLIARGGRFETPIGYEALEPWRNNQISRSRAWQLQPISQDGLTVSAGARNLGLMVGIVNSFSVDDTEGNDADSDKGVLASATAELGDVDASLTLLYSPDDIGSLEREQLLLNPIFSIDLGGVAFAVEANWLEVDPGAAQGTGESWNVTGYASAIYRRLQLSVRADVGNYDPQPPAAVATVNGTDIWSVTTTIGWILSRRMDLRIEYRHDDADNARFFAEKDERFATDTADVVQAQLVWYPEGW